MLPHLPVRFRRVHSFIFIVYQESCAKLYSLKKQLSVPDLRLLISSHDALQLKQVFTYLEPMGYQLDCASGSDEVYNCLKTSWYNAIILSAQLSDQYGVPLYTRLRMESVGCPLILLAPEGTMDSLPRYLNSGADDVVISPLHMLEMEARVLAAIRLSNSHASSPKLSWAGIELNVQTHTVTCDGKNMHLPPMAFTLLASLMKAAPNVVSRSELQVALYGDTPPNSDALRTYIHILRTHLEKENKPILKTVPKVGFRLTPMP